MPRQHRRHSTAFKRQIVEEYHSGTTLHALSKRHDICRQLIRVWIEKHEAGAYDDDAEAVDLIQERDAHRRAGTARRSPGARDRVVSKGAARHAALPGSAPGSAITGPKASPSNGGAS